MMDDNPTYRPLTAWQDSQLSVNTTPFTQDVSAIRFAFGGATVRKQVIDISHGPSVNR